MLVRCRRLSGRISDPEFEVVNRSRPIYATLDHNSVDDGIESRCSRYLDVRSAAEEAGAYGDVGIGSVVGSE